MLLVEALGSIVPLFSFKVMMLKSMKSTLNSYLWKLQEELRKLGVEDVHVTSTSNLSRGAGDIVAI